MTALNAVQCKCKFDGTWSTNEICQGQADDPWVTMCPKDVDDSEDDSSSLLQDKRGSLFEMRLTARSKNRAAKSALGVFQDIHDLSVANAGKELC